MVEPFVLSASSVSTFLRCGQQWYFAYVAAVRAAPRLKAVRGIAVHRAVEVDMTQKVASMIDLPVEDMLDAYDTSWNSEVSYGVGKDDDEDEGAIKDAGYRLVRLYRRDVAPRIQPAIVEHPVQFEVNGQPFSGQIDVGQWVPKNLHGEPELALENRDTKTTARKPDPTQYMLNMTGYALGVRQAGFGTEADTVFDYLVATTRPYYHEVRLGGPISDDQVRRFSHVVGSVAESIKAGRFVPNGLMSGACTWCGFRPMCPAYIKQEMKEGA